ncbi:MAG: helix-turn-helix domain-containing protein [Selenomonas sp.]|nr:helix-turn-helix domain-containing protein [Selenomonas sp.]
MSALGNKEIMAQNIKHYMKAFGIDRKEFCNRLGFKYSTVTDWLNAEKYPRIDKIEMMANFFSINKADLVEPHNSIPTVHAGYKIPVLGRVAAGVPIEAVEEILGYEYLDDKYKNDGCSYFALRIEGRSMEPTIMDGDTVIVRQQSYIESGQIAIVLVDGEDATAKQVKESPDGITLIGHNAAVYTPQFYSAQEIEDLPVKIIGRVIEVRREL